MSLHLIHGVQIDIRGADEQGRRPNPRYTQLQQLIHSLQLMPAEHLRLLPPIIVGARPPLAHRTDEQGHERLVPIGGSELHVAIRLHFGIFEKSWNRGDYNETVLHEAGHIIDWSNGYMADLRSHHAELHQQLTGREYHGVTTRQGEYFADAYKNYLLDKPSAAERRAMELTAFQTVQRPVGLMCGP